MRAATAGRRWGLGAIVFAPLMLVAVVLPASLSAEPAEAAKRSKARPRLALVGGERRNVPVCGRSRNASVVTEGGRLAARVRVRGRRSRRRALVVVDRCVGGRWRRESRARPRGRRVLRRAIATRAAGDLRMRAFLRGRRGARSRPAYARVVRAGQVGGALVDVPVRFEVENVNRSKLACSSDGRRYAVAGRLVAPRAALERGGPRSVALYLHEYGWGKFFFGFPDERYDYARAMARAGHASVIVDRPGYDESGAPEGTGTCLGSQADMAHQVVGQLRAGRYQASGSPAPAFSRVAVGGHSGGGAIAEIAAYSFGGIDALMLFAYADSDFTPRSTQEATEQGATCTTGGERQDEDGPGGYAYFAQTPEEWRGFHFHSAEVAVADRAAAMRNRDPCGDASSLVPAVASNQQHAAEIKVPALLLYGTRDAIYEQPKAGENQRKLLSGSRDVTLRFFPDTAHSLLLERRAPEIRAVASDWLARRGF